jgi:hypothetical protein
LTEDNPYKLRIGQVLRYPRASEDPEIYSDGLLNFRWLARFQDAGAFQLERGINTPLSITGSDGILRRPAIIISSSPHKKGSAETPWQDFFDPDNGHIRYFGDNKDPGKDPAKAPGNKALLEAFRLAHSFDANLRAKTPPLLYFERTKKGYAVFQGFGVIRSVDLVTQWDNKKQRTFTNYAFDFVVFNLEKEHEVVDWNWIASRRDSLLTLDETNARAPSAWREWIKNGSNHLERVRRRVARLSIEKAANQKPVRNSETESILEQIYQYYSGRKHKFEALAELIAAQVIDPDGARYERGWITPAGSDGGADFIASIRLGSEFSASKVIVLGQAKCVSLSNPTHGNHIARTVARLKRGWIGVFVTTSYFSEAVQQEVIEDRYPIVLIHGKRLAEEVAKIVHEDDRFKSVADLLNHLTMGYESRIQYRQPEEILYLSGRPLGTVSSANAEYKDAD